MTFRVGQKVVCVNDGAVDGAGNCEWGDDEKPVVGEVYTVIRSYIFDGEPCVHLAEICRDQIAVELWGPDVGYGAERFRPLIERKTDISFAHEILRKASTNAPELV